MGIDCKLRDLVNRAYVLSFVGTSISLEVNGVHLEMWIAPRTVKPLGIEFMTSYHTIEKMVGWREITDGIPNILELTLDHAYRQLRDQFSAEVKAHGKS